MEQGQFSSAVSSLNAGRKFGTFYGVYLPGVLTMFGVIIYLRLGYLLGSVGLAQLLLIISLSCSIVLITVFSISSSATNMDVGGGGTYYMISRSLGIEVGSAVGVPLFIAQALSVSFCSMGFAESVQPFFPEISLQTIGIASVCVLMLLAYFSSGAAMNVQFAIFVIILASMISLFMGKPITEVEGVAQVPLNPPLPFWACFAMFFPAATGVEAGISMSGNLHSPRRSLPLGSIAVVLTGLCVYCSIPLFLDSHVPRELLLNDPLIVQHLSKFQSLIIAGIWAATLSSALGGLLAAPRTLQALAKDGIFPEIFSKEYGRHKEPRAATILSFVIALVGIYYGSIDKVAPVLSMFYLIAYGVLNLATGMECLMGNFSWRPTFRVPWHVSILGVVLCTMAMLMIDPGATFIALLFVVLIYLYMRRRKLSGDWEDIRHGVLLFLSRFAIYRLSSGKKSMRSWRPNFLVFSESPANVSNLISLTSAMAGDKGFLTLVSIFPPTFVDQAKVDRWKTMVSNLLREKNIEALVEFSVDEDVASGAKKFLTNYGIGSISPNTVVLGESGKQENLTNFLSLVQLSCQSQKNVLIVREKNSARSSSPRIEIWWDDASRCNSELMVLLGHMLSLNKEWKGADLNIKSLVSHESVVPARSQYFHQFFECSRLAFKTQIHVKEAGASSDYEQAARFYDQPDLTFIGLRSFRLEETIEEYQEYYRPIFNATEKVDNAVFVIASSHTDLKGIFT